MSQHAARPAVVKPLAESLWFPMLFFFGFLFCYLLAFHSPSPHHVTIAVSDPKAAAVVQAELNHAVPGGFDITAEPNAAAARQAVLDRTAYAGFAADSAQPTLYVAKADGYTLESVITQAFTPLGQGHLVVTDVAPTASGDALGTGLFYLALALNIPSYVTVMMLLRAVTFSRVHKVLTILGVGAFFSVVGYFVGTAMHVIPANPLFIPIAFALVEAVALTSFGLAPFVKQFFPGVAMGLFVLLSMPSSGGAIPVPLVPRFFAALHPFMPLGNLIEALRGILYFHGVGVLRPVLVLAAWIVLGLALIGLHVLLERRSAREPVAQPPVEDPALEVLEPLALPTGAHHFGTPAPMLRGRVQDEHAHPVTGIPVTVTGTHGRQLVRTVTDRSGGYAVTGLPEGFVDIVVSAHDQQPAVRRVLIREGRESEQDFTVRDRNLVSA